MKPRFNKLFIDVGVGSITSRQKEAWDRKKDFAIIGLEPSIGRYNTIKDVYPGRLLNAAASDKDGELDCWEDMSGKHGVVAFKAAEHKGYGMKRVKKKTIRLDNLEWRGFNEIHIWADIEGSELIMLKGATEMLLSKKVKWILVEIRVSAPVGSDGWATAKQVYAFLNKYGFKPTINLDRLHPKKHRDVVFIPK